MIIAYLIDTDWVVHHLNGHVAIMQRLQALQPEGLGLSVAALAELMRVSTTHATRLKASRSSMTSWRACTSLASMKRQQKYLAGNADDSAPMAC